MKQCPKCSSFGEDDDLFCKNCGEKFQPDHQPPSTYSQPPFHAYGYTQAGYHEPYRMDYPTQPFYPVYTVKTNALAVASLVLGVISVISACFDGIGVIPGIVGLILGIVAKIKISKSHGLESGDGLALAGIILSSVAIAIAIGFIVMLLLLMFSFSDSALFRQLQ